MRAILPGRPQSKRQAISTAHWDDLRLVAYISGSAAIIATGPNDLLQTIYIDTETSLHAIAIEESSGQIAVCGDKNVYIYIPRGREEGVLSWVQGHHLKLEEDEVVTSLSWGSPEEVMVGGSKLWLWYIEDDQRVIWSQHIPFPTAMAYFSHDGGLLASCGHHDRTVKVWRRQSYEIESTRFDVSYLPHPTSVTNLHWRKPWHSEMNLDNLLYTFCADNHVRVWAYTDPHSVSIMQMVAEIDMTVTIQPRRLSVGSMSRKRYAFIIDSRDFSTATEKAVLDGSPGETDHALEHLIGVANRSPEICVVLDGLGHMSVWGLENAGCRNKNSTEVFNIAHVDDVNISIIQGAPKMQDYTQFCIFAGNDSSLSLLVHSFDGSISWYQAHITHLFDTAPRKERVRQIASWGGHHHPVNGMVRNESGDLLCSWSDSEILVWKLTRSQVLKKVYSAKCSQVRDALFLGDELRVLDKDQLLRYGALLDDKIGTKDQKASQISGKEETESRRLLECGGSTGIIHEDGAISVPRTGKSLANPSAETLFPCSSSGWLTAVTASAAGVLSGVKCAEKRLETVDFSILTTIKSPSRVTGVASGKIAMTDASRLQLFVWDLRLGTCERVMTFHDTIESLYWHQTAHGSLTLAVCFAFHVVLLKESRFTSGGESESWVKLRDIRIRDFTGHSIGAVCCLDDGSVVIGAGNQLFVLDHSAGKAGRPSPSTPTGLDLANTSLPVYHPEMLNALLSLGEFELVHRVLNYLHEELKYFSEGDQLTSMLGLTTDQITLSEDHTPHSSQANGMNGNHTNGHVALQDISERLKENVERHRISHLSSVAQSSLSHTINVVLELEPYRSSLDGNALEYLRALYSCGADAELPWSAIVFASMSTSQEPLADLVTRFYGGKLTWEAAQRSGMFLWLADVEALKVQMENVGRAEYNKNEDRNPVDCALYYLALGKKNVLQGLWRTTVGVRERDNTLKLLANNFSDPRWKSTALKNAYALLSKRRFEYGAAFFLLGRSLKDAVNVCASQVEDLQLAVAIARVYESSDAESVLKDLIENTILNAAVDSDQGRWMAAWAYNMLRMPEKAIQVLVRPVHEVVGKSLSGFNGVPQSLNWKVNDPLLEVLYVQLREQLVKKRAWQGVLKPGEERDFILRCARFYVRIGADLLALRLVRNWRFVEETREVKVLPIRRGSLVDTSKPADIIVDVEKEPSPKERKKQPPTQFTEPTADSLLDSFGF